MEADRHPGQDRAHVDVQEYAGDHQAYARIVDKPWFPFHLSNEYWELWYFVWWTGWRVIGYLLFLMAVVALLPGEKIRDYGWSFAIWGGILIHVGVAVSMDLLTIQNCPPQPPLPALITGLLL